MLLKPIKKTIAPRVIKNWSGRKLTGVADEALLNGAGVVSEGLVEKGDQNAPVYAGTTMISVDLSPFRRRLESDSFTSEDLLDQLIRSVAFRLKLMRLARREAEQRCAPGLLGSFSTELEFKIEQDLLLIDIDVIGSIDESVDSSSNQALEGV